MTGANRPKKYRALNQQIREAFADYGCGKTARAVAEDLGVTTKQARIAMEAMPDAYIEDWLPDYGATPWQAVWNVVQVPADKPKPATPRQYNQANRKTGGAK